MINRIQLREFIIEPALKSIDMYSGSAVMLLEITAAVESRLGYYIKQISGPALGIYQMEPETFWDTYVNNIVPRKLIKKILAATGYKSFAEPEVMCRDLHFATIVARIHYSRFREPLPSNDDFNGLVEYYYKYWRPNPLKTSLDDAIKRAKTILKE